MKVFAIATLLGLAFLLGLFPFTQGEADHYLVEIEEKGTKFLEEIDIDEKQDVEVFRVPNHNNVSGADFYHDFKKRVTVTKLLSQKVCYISEMDSSLTSPGTLKEDLERASLQPGKLPVTTKSNLVTVTGPADRLRLTKEVLEFCRALPIYNTELSPSKSARNGTQIVRQRRNTLANFVVCDRFNALAKIKDCMDSYWDLSCKIISGSRYYRVKCTKRPRRIDWYCIQTHMTFSYPQCCNFICP